MLCEQYKGKVWLEWYIDNLGTAAIWIQDIDRILI